MKLIEMNIQEVIPYEGNPRNNKNAIEKVARSIKDFGFRNPIIVDKNKVIIVGHTRLLAAKSLNLQAVPVIIANDLSEKQVKAFRIADNKTSEYAEWDAKLLNQELIDLEAAGFDLLSTAFEINELSDLMKSFTDLPDNLLGDFDNQEINIDDYDEEEFDCKCPKCGFLFNKEV
ncbi:ParB N-terminal domain-containing protein [Carnobacterium maltaromaticum]|uniref:ParB N-terminal domain-containing protein n=1 Tax=Carnobacterium maltaromaticum TaxID=2751 RepID=UPI00165CB8AB|nr:ParB N-terminal domain-containing protein [Carnobacterium maltaromaticum]MBC9808174.1 chromosome partitioning protein ParB [Carnobacterium maltaromaticum]